jgi:hypothetical protein
MRLAACCCFSAAWGVRKNYDERSRGRGRMPFAVAMADEPGSGGAVDATLGLFPSRPTPPKRRRWPHYLMTTVLRTDLAAA